MLSVTALGTFSYFNDTETSSGNIFAAGTLDLQVDGKNDPLGAYLSLSNLKPNDSGALTVVLSNAGTLRGNAYIHFKDVVDAPGTTPESEPTPDYGELSANLWISVSNGTAIIAEGFLSKINCTLYALGMISGGGTLNVTISWSVPSGVGNEIMGDSVTFTVEFRLDQA